MLNDSISELLGGLEQKAAAAEAERWTSACASIMTIAQLLAVKNRVSSSAAVDLASQNVANGKPSPQFGY